MFKKISFLLLIFVQLKSKKPWNEASVTFPWLIKDLKIIIIYAELLHLS